MVMKSMGRVMISLKEKIDVELVGTCIVWLFIWFIIYGN